MKNYYLSGLFMITLCQVKAQTLELVKDIYPGASNGLSSFTEASFIQDAMIFPATNSAVGRELFILKDDSVRVLKDISPGPGGSATSGLFHFKGEVYFFAAASGSLEIWKTDGTEEGTKKAISFADETFNYNDIFITSGDDKFYFTRNDHVYVSDGTQNGTYKIVDGPAIIFEKDFAFATLNADRFVGGAAFVASTDTSYQLFSVKDTIINLLGTFNVSSQNSFSVVGPFEVNMGLVLFVRDGAGNVGDLYLYNKTSGVLAKYNSNPLVVSRVNRLNDNQLLVTTDNNSFYVTNGTLTGTIKILSTAPFVSTGSSLPFVRIGNSAIFHGDDPGGADAVYSTNGTAAGTKLRKSIPGNGISNFVSKDPYAFWITDLFFNGTPQVWWSDIHTSGATLLYTHPSPFNNVTYEISPIGVSSRKIYFIAKIDPNVGKELYSLEHHLNIPTGTYDISKNFSAQIIQDREQASFKVVIDGKHEMMQLDVYSINGEQVLSKTVSENEWIRLPSVQGAYAVTILAKEGFFSRVIVQ